LVSKAIVAGEPFCANLSQAISQLLLRFFGKVQFPGKAEASKKVELAFQVSGLLVKLPVKEGQKVTKGELIAQLRQDEFQARLKALQGQLERWAVGFSRR
jgi:multidrug efflux pump subunit AcrA (membrane-fusion protein)